MEAVNEIHDVVGPDEYHERVNNNVYTNKMAQLTFKTAYELLEEIDSFIGAYPSNRVTEMIREFSFTEKSVLLKDLYKFSDDCEIKERFVTYIKPSIHDASIELDEVKLLFDSTAWEVSVSEAIHVNHFRVEEKVYLIDFVSRNLESEFVIEICMD